MVCFLAFLHASRVSLARLYQYVVAKTIVVERNSQEELVAHVRRFIRRPWALVDFQTLLFWNPNVARACSRSLRRSRGSGCSWDTSSIRTEIMTD